MGARMASDDMHVVIYRILAYIYACMKRGDEPDRGEISHEALGIPRGYWSQIMCELYEHGYVSGLTVTKTTSGPSISFSRPRVTLDGVQFLMENSMMAKAVRFLQDTKSSVPFI